MIRKGAQSQNEQAEHIRRLVLFQGTTLSPGDALALEEGDINCATMLKHGVTWDNVVAANIDARNLKNKHGFNSVHELKQLGLDAIELTEGVLVQQLIELYGLDVVREAFFSTPDDATSLANSEGARMLGITTRMLLECCAGAPDHAASVLRASGSPSQYLSNIGITTLLDTGLRGPRLIKLGINAILLINEIRPTPTAQDIRQLGLERSVIPQRGM